MRRSEELYSIKMKIIEYYSNNIQLINTIYYLCYLKAVILDFFQNN
jgi:hypothetical protein